MIISLTSCFVSHSTFFPAADKLIGPMRWDLQWMKIVRLVGEISPVLGSVLRS